MRSDRVEVLAPLLDDDSGLLQAVEDFTVQAFVAQFAVEGLAVAVFPWAAGRNVERLCSELGEPVAHDLGCHLRAVVRPDVFWHTTFEHYLGHRLDDTEAVDPASHPDCQALPGVLVDQSHQPQLAPIVGLRLVNGRHRVTCCQRGDLIAAAHEETIGGTTSASGYSNPLFRNAINVGIDHQGCIRHEAPPKGRPKVVCFASTVIDASQIGPRLTVLVESRDPFRYLHRQRGVTVEERKRYTAT